MYMVCLHNKALSTSAAKHQWEGQCVVSLLACTCTLHVEGWGLQNGGPQLAAGGVELAVRGWFGKNRRAVATPMINRMVVHYLV